MYNLTKEQLDKLPGYNKPKTNNPKLLLRTESGDNLKCSNFSNSQLFNRVDIRPKIGESIYNDYGTKYRVIEMEWLSVPEGYGPLLRIILKEEF